MRSITPGGSSQRLMDPVLHAALRPRGAAPAADRSLADFQQALLRKYDHQIRLLKNVKYWYLLPPYVALLPASAGMVMANTAKGQPGRPQLIAVGVYTGVFGFMWWLNEGPGVRTLRRERTRLLEEMKPAAE
jgi:hypothetical protein